MRDDDDRRDGRGKREERDDLLSRRMPQLHNDAGSRTGDAARISAWKEEERRPKREIASTKTKTKRNEKNRARSFAKRNAATKSTRGKRKRERGKVREEEGDLIEINCKRARVNSLRLPLGTIATA